MCLVFRFYACKKCWKTLDTRVDYKASPDTNAATDLRTELLTKTEVQSAEIWNQLNQLRAELQFAHDNTNGKSEALDKQVVALETATNRQFDYCPGAGHG